MSQTVNTESPLIINNELNPSYSILYGIGFKFSNETYGSINAYTLKYYEMKFNYAKPKKSK